MAMIEEHSLVPYDPSRSVLGYRVPGQTPSLPERASAPTHRHAQSETGSLTAKPLRPRHAHSVYSFRRTIEASRTAATGLVVDIFV